MVIDCRCRELDGLLGAAGVVVFQLVLAGDGVQNHRDIEAPA